MNGLEMDWIELGSDEEIMSGVKLDWQGDLMLGMVGQKRFVELVRRFDTDVIFCVIFVFYLVFDFIICWHFTTNNQRI